MIRILSCRRSIHMNVTVQITVQRIGETIHTFELKRRVSNIIAVIKHFVDLMLNIRSDADVKIISEDVSRHRPQALCKTPNMDIMNTKYTVNSSNVFDHRLDIHITRRSFEQDINGVPQNSPGI